MKVKKPLEKVRIMILETLFIAIFVILFLCFYNGTLSEILGVIIGTFLTAIFTNSILIFNLYHEDENKVAKDNFPYDKSYIVPVHLYNKNIDVWYEPYVNSRNCEYEVIDTNETHYKLPTLIEANYISLYNAHEASIKKNYKTIRLDDVCYDKENDKATLYTSRSNFFNDLVTNRAVDYKINGSVSLREIYESKKFLSSLRESVFSNHIGINVMVFKGDYMYLAHRGRAGTISKNSFTSTVAIGMFENDIDTLGTISSEEIKKSICWGLFKNKFADLLSVDRSVIQKLIDDKKIQTYFLGFGRLIYVGGKPQFYYAAVIDDDISDEKLNFDKKSVGKSYNILDANEGLVKVKKIELDKSGEFTLKVTTDNDKVLRRSVEKSFFANYYHLVTQEKIPGIPQWIYDAWEKTE